MLQGANSFDEAFEAMAKKTGGNHQSVHPKLQKALEINNYKYVTPVQ